MKGAEIFDPGPLLSCIFSPGSLLTTSNYRVFEGASFFYCSCPLQLRDSNLSGD